VVVDKNGHVAVVQYLKNVEGCGFPPEPKTAVTKEVEAARSVTELFR
jgi:hypothetical protein